MPKFETNQIDVKGDGKIILYQRPDVKKPKWYARISVQGATGYKIFSTKETDQRAAERIALDRYEELYFKVRRGGTLKGKPFRAVFGEWKSSAFVLAYEGTQSHLQAQILKVERIGVGFFGAKPIDEISEGDLEGMMSWFLNEYEEPPASSTIRSYGYAMNLLFQYAKTKGYTDSIPNIPVPPLKANPRPDFNKREWTTLYTHMREWINQPRRNSVKGEIDERLHRDRYYLQQYVLILANTGIRVGEMRNVCWGHLDKVEVELGDERVLLRVSGKTGERDVIANAGVNVYIRRLWDYRSKELGRAPDMGEFLFCKSDGSRVGRYTNGFNALLESSGLRIQHPSGKNRTLYSLRHTYATMRINEVPVYQLAVNMGTSVDMIERYYSHARTRSPEFAKTMTQGNQSAEGNALPF